MLREFAAFLFLHELIEDEKEAIHWGDRMQIAVPDLLDRIEALPPRTSDVDIQTVFYDVGKQYIGESKDELRKFFEILYCVCTGSRTGARWGMIVNIYGPDLFVYHMRNQLDNLFYVAVRDK